MRTWPITILALATLLLANDTARAQRLANRRPSHIAQHQSPATFQEIAEQPTEPNSDARADPNLELITPANPQKDPTAVSAEPGLETDCDDRFHLGLGKGLGLGLGRLCRPRFGFANLRESFPRPEPMTGASWLSRPLHVDAFSGVIYGGPLIEDSVRRQGDIFSGFRLGWDWTRRLGGEMRFAFAQIGTEDIPSGIELDDADVVYWDLNVLWYPSGDTRVRPYLSLGLGAEHVDFVDAESNGHQKELFTVPIAAGIKYRATPWCAVRADITDNIAFPYDDIAMQGNISITVSAEFHFGGQRTSYWPWNPTLQSW